MVLMPDRPSWAVEAVIEKHRDRPNVIVQAPSLPIMSPEHGQQWTRARNESMQIFDDAGWTARWHANHDDDWLYGPGWDDPTTGLPACLADEEAWSWKIVSLFLWGQDQDGVAQVNSRQYHFSPLFGRYQTGWRYDPKLTNQIPMSVERHIEAHPDSEKTLPFFLMDCGTISDAERRRLYCDYANAGKLDPYTKRYIQMPRLMPLPKVLKRYKKPVQYWEDQKRTVLRERAIVDG